MNAIQFPQVNLNLGAGNNPNTVNLPVAICANGLDEYKDVAFMVSCFKLTPEDLARINKTGVIWLSVMTKKPIDDKDRPGKIILQGTQQPVMLLAENPFDEKEINPPFIEYSIDSLRNDDKPSESRHDIEQ